MRLVWLTDIHLNFLRPSSIEAFLNTILAESPDGILLGGDIGEAPSLVEYLKLLETKLGLPVFFVLGNHDFYRGSIHTVRTIVADLTRTSAKLSWLNLARVIPLSGKTALIGHDGWGDGRLGDAMGSSVVLNDFLLIEELRLSNKKALLAVLNRLGDEAAAHFGITLPAALQRHDHVIALTHVPPFREATWHEGRISDDDWLPYFSCKAVGDVLRAVMLENPHRRLSIYCGHTHGAGVCQILPNLTVYTGGAEYGAPCIQEIITVE